MKTIILRQRVSHDVGHASNALADAMGLDVWDMHADENPNRDDSVRLFLDAQLKHQPWRRYIDKGADRARLAKKLDGSHVILMTSIAGNRGRLRETNMEYGAQMLREQFGVNSLSLVLTKTPHDRNDRAFVNATTKEPEYNAEIGRLFARKVAGIADRFFTIGLHSTDAKQHYYDALGEENCFFYDAGELAAKAIAHDFPKEVGKKDIVIITPDSGDKLGRKPLVEGIVRGLTVHNILYPDNALDLSKDFKSRAKRVEEAPNFDALAKRRDSEYDVEILHISDAMRSKINGKSVLLVDDTTDTAGTLIEAAEELLDNGAKSIMAFVPHAVLAHYKRGKEKSLKNGHVVGNALAYVNQREWKKGRPSLSRLYATRTIANIDDRINQVVSNGDRDRFRIINPAPLIVPAIIHAMDQAEGRPLTPIDDMPQLHMDLFDARGLVDTVIPAQQPQHRRA